MYGLNIYYTKNIIYVRIKYILYQKYILKKLLLFKLYNVQHLLKLC
jgi:hypothetical protein